MITQRISISIGKTSRMEIDAEVSGLVAVHVAPSFSPCSVDAVPITPDAFAWKVTHIPSGLSFNSDALPKDLADALAAELAALPQDDWMFYDPYSLPSSFVAAVRPICVRYAQQGKILAEARGLRIFRARRRGFLGQLRVLRDLLEQAINELESHREDEPFREYVTELVEEIEGLDMGGPLPVVEPSEVRA